MFMYGFRRKVRVDHQIKRKQKVTTEGIRKIIDQLWGPTLHDPPGNLHRVLDSLLCHAPFLVVHDGDRVLLRNNLHGWLSSHHAVSALTTRNLKQREARRKECRKMNRRSYDISPPETLLHRLKKKAGSFAVILLHETTVGLHRGEVIRENALVEGHQITLLGGLHELKGLIIAN